MQYVVVLPRVAFVAPQPWFEYGFVIDNPLGKGQKMKYICFVKLEVRPSFKSLNLPMSGI